jgi:hypothetical protein
VEEDCEWLGGDTGTSCALRSPRLPRSSLKSGPLFVASAPTTNTAPATPIRCEPYDGDGGGRSPHAADTRPASPSGVKGARRFRHITLACIAEGAVCGGLACSPPNLRLHCRRGSVQQGHGLGCSLTASNNGPRCDHAAIATWLYSPGSTFPGLTSAGFICKRHTRIHRSFWKLPTENGKFRVSVLLSAL